MACVLRQQSICTDQVASRSTAEGQGTRMVSFPQHIRAVQVSYAVLGRRLKTVELLPNGLKVGALRELRAAGLAAGQRHWKGHLPCGIKQAPFHQKPIDVTTLGGRTLHDHGRFMVDYQGQSAADPEHSYDFWHP